MSLNAGVFSVLQPHAWRSPETDIANAITTYSCPIWDRPPDILQARLICKVADNEWPVGAELDAASCFYSFTISTSGAPGLYVAWIPGSIIIQSPAAPSVAILMPRRLTPNCFYTMNPGTFKAVAVAIWLAN